jgi:hypothetical protein
MGLNQFGMLHILASAEVKLYVTVSLAVPYALMLFSSCSEAWSLHGLLLSSLLVLMQQ